MWILADAAQPASGALVAGALIVTLAAIVAAVLLIALILWNRRRK
jgi:hypothetical protein